MPQNPPKQCVYIERPPTINAAGNKVSQLAVGTKLDDDPPKDAKKKKAAGGGDGK